MRIALYDSQFRVNLTYLMLGFDEALNFILSETSSTNFNYQLSSDWLPFANTTFKHSWRDLVWYLKWPYQVYPSSFFLLFRAERSVWNWEFRAEPEILGLLADILKPLFESLVMTIATAMYITESSKSITIPVLMTDNDGIPCSKSVWTGHKAEIEEIQVQ